jgi:Fic family protein
MNNWIEITEALSQLPFLEEVSRKKKELDALRPFSQEVEGRVMQKLRLEWNYHSNAIEGNKLT